MNRFSWTICLSAAGALLLAGCSEKPRRPASSKTRPVIERTNRVVRTAPPRLPPNRTMEDPRRGTMYRLDADNGLLGMNFGRAEAEIPGLTEVSSDPDRRLKVCTRAREAKQLHEVPLERVEYRFYRGELYAIQISWRVEHPESALSRPPTTDMSVRLAGDYGAPRIRRVSKEGAEYVWRGRRVEAKLTETLFSGIPDIIKGGWSVPPTTVGRLVVRNLTLARAAEGQISAHAGAEAGDL